MAAITGDTVSLTVTMAVLLSLLPLTSTTLKLTTLFPISSQVKDVRPRLISSIPQASELPLSISLTAILASPFPSR